MSVLIILGAMLTAVILIGTIVLASEHLTDKKSNDELAGRMPDGSAINKDGYGAADVSDCGGGD